MNANQTTEKSAVSPLTEAAREPTKPRKQPAVVVSPKRDRDDIVWQFLAAITEIRARHTMRIVEAAEDLLHRRPLRKEGKRVSGILRFETGDIVDADWPHFLTARMVSSLARNAGKKVNFRYFWNDAELAEFQERRREAGIKREREAAEARRAKTPPRRAPQPENRPPTGTSPSGVGTTKPMPKGKPAARGESTHSDAARDSNTVTAIAVAEGKPRSEIAQKLGVEPAEEERQIRRLHHLGGVFAAIGRRVWADEWENLFSQIARVEAGEPESVPAAPEVVADFVAGFVRKPAKKRARREGVRATA